MLDIQLIRKDPETVKKRVATRGGKESNLVDQILEIDIQRRQVLSQVERLQSERNRISKQIGQLIVQNNQEQSQLLKKQVKEINDQIDNLQLHLKQLEELQNQIMLQIPNLPHESVPIGYDSSANVVVRSWGEKPKFSFTPKNHIELCERLGLIDFRRATKLAGSGFIAFTHIGARLERALIQFMLDLHIHQHGYIEISPPYIVNRDIMIGVGQFPKFEDQAYAVQEGLDSSTLGKWYLIPTAEAPVANFHREEILHEEELPKCYVSYTPCFRAEAGAAGVGTRGLIRVHQFDKVELIRIVHPERGFEELEIMVTHAEKVLQLLGLHYRVVLLCTGELGFASAKTYDIEVWAPGQGEYLEVSSCSNCGDFQSRRMALRFKEKSTGKNRYPHILNGSGVALARLFVAIVETYQQADGSILIPPALIPYINLESIKP